MAILSLNSTNLEQLSNDELLMLDGGMDLYDVGLGVCMTAGGIIGAVAGSAGGPVGTAAGTIGGAAIAGAVYVWLIN